MSRTHAAEPKIAQASCTARPRIPPGLRLRRAEDAPNALAHYLDPAGRCREVLVRAGFEGSSLVIDRDSTTLGDCRLIAHLAADEPPQNAVLVCASYLKQLQLGSGRCRRLTAADFRTPPLVDDEECLAAHPDPVDRLGRTYTLEQLPAGMSIPELRWRRCAPKPSECTVVSVREAVGALESYEPVRMLTRRALALADRELSTVALRTELARVQRSPIVLNRGLREAVLSRVGEEGLSMSEIALRCGRIKNDARGGESGETSWLARRLGLVPEGGKGRPTPWIHSDVLALIARQGLGISPREVELS